MLSVDERSKIQALGRTQPDLADEEGPHRDYKRNRTLMLFAALDMLEGKVIGHCMQRHCHQEFVRILKADKAEVPKRKSVHVVQRR